MTPAPQIISRWIVYDNVEHEFSIYYDEQEAKKEYEARIKQINDDVGTDEYEGEEEVYLCQVLSKAEVVEVARDEQSDDALYRLIPYDCASHSASSDVLDELRLWRMKRMNGTLKKDVWQAWNEETDFINKIRQQTKEREQG